MKKIKALYIGGFELPDKNAAAHRVLSNAKVIRDFGGQVVFAGVDKEQAWNKPILDTKGVHQGFTTFSVPYPTNKKEWINYLTDIGSYIDIIEADTSINTIIFYNFPAVAMKKLLIYCHQKGIKCVADVTEWYSASGKGFAFFVIKGIDTWLRMHVYHKQMDGLIVISKYLADYYSKQNNVIRIPPLIDLKEAKWNDLQEKKNNGKINLVYAGSPAIKDRIDVLIQALKLVKRPYHLDVVGITTEQYLTRGQEDEDFVMHNTNINFHGRLSHKDALNYVSSADYSCFFREDDRMTKAGFSTKFVEAITCGTPVLTNRTSNIDEFCMQGENAVLLNGITTKEIADAIDIIQIGMKTRKTQFDYRSYIGIMNSFFYGINANN